MANPLKILDTVGDVIKGGKGAGKTAGSKGDDIIDAEVVDVVEDGARAGTRAAAATKEATEKAEKASRLGGIAKGGALAGGVLGVGYVGTKLAGSGDETPELVKPNGGGVTGAIKGAAGGMRDAVGMGSGTIEFDPEVLEPFINELNARADEMEAVAASGADAFAALQGVLSRDTLGAPTRSGGASPIVADMDQALGKSQEAFTAAAQGVVAQLRGDAKRLTAILTGHLDNEAESAARIDNIDTNL